MADAAPSGTVRTKNSYASAAELFERVRDERFSAGRPALVTSGPFQAIVFPPLDRQSQVSFMMLGMNRIRVQRSPMPLVVGHAGDGASSSVNAGLLERLIKVTADELRSLGL